MARHVDIERLSNQLKSIGECAKKLESDYSDDLAAVHPEFRDSALNLVHYLALRQSDISELQEDLASLGLSSLGRAERNVMGSVNAVRTALQKLGGNTGHDPDLEGVSLQLRNPRADAHKKAILGDHPAGRDVNIMVTLPIEAGENQQLVSEMIAAGMDLARINCAHDDAATWQAMVKNVRAASAEAKKDCRIIMDLAGPKLRTGELRPGPRVIHLRPRRDPLGRVIAPRRIRFMPDDVLQRGTKAAVIPVPRECIESAEEGNEFRFRDTRGKKRRLIVVDKDAKGLVLETWKGVYIATGTKLRLVQHDVGEKLTYRVGELPAIEQPILLRVGDTLILHKDNIPGAPAKEDAEGNIVTPAHVACQQPEVFEFVSAGDPISLNDGKISGIVRSVTDDQLEVEITKAKPTGSRLRGNRGINFPGSDIRLPGLTAFDRENLRFVIENADAVSLSFVREPGDVTLLQEALAQFPDKQVGLVIKVETKRGFKNLPRLLLTTMRSYPAGVMIARGDLAVECGWERLAELQEEILWLCEAAQMPVMWATQVLEQKAKKGQPSRAEISDAAMSQLADCVMLNKGPHILAAIRMLDNILRRMQKHHFKKTARMRELSFSEDGD
ncbi:MAG: pyruvate kinase [Gammaproteobacteria bacterium]|nr:pyruvate kinase [Gammaproteobacteria bacterium]